MEQPVSGPAKRAAVIINPSKPSSAGVREIVEGVCDEEGWTAPLWLETTIEDPGPGQALTAIEEGADVVIAAGGDGTVRYVAEVLAGTGIALGIVPLGTGNLLARNLGIDVTDPAAAMRECLLGQEKPVDVVRARVDNAGEDLVFLVMAGMGFDASVMADTDAGLKDRVGWLAYVDAGIRNLAGKPVRARISIDGRPPVRRRVRSVMVGNCGKVQGGIEIFPGASVNDGILDLVVIAPSGRFGWFGVLTGLVGALLGKRRGKDPAVEYFQGTSAEITMAVPQDFQLDGDHSGEGSHLTVAMDPGALLVRYPES
jgi:diacylglycerol kinase family enzyme